MTASDPEKHRPWTILKYQSILLTSLRNHNETFFSRFCNFELYCSNIRYASGLLLTQLRTKSTRSYQKYASQEKSSSLLKFDVRLFQDVDSYPEPDPTSFSTASVDLTEFSTEDGLTFDTSEPFIAATPDISSCTNNGISNKLQKRDGARCDLKKGGNSDPEPSDVGLLEPSLFSMYNIPDGTACRHPKYPKHLCCDGPVGRAEKADGYVHMGYVDVCFLCKVPPI